MKQDVAIELLKIAAKLTEVAVANKVKTAASLTKTPSVEGIFEDCLQAVEAHFGDLTGGAK
jgi:homospermidine synthase